VNRWCIVKYWVNCVSFLVIVFAIQASTQSIPKGQINAQETQIRGYWVDPSSGLMWAGRDNGKDVTWKEAMKYCHDLRLAGYHDWRLANIGELNAIYDEDANAPGQDGQGPSTWHVKGNLFLTGNQWSSTRLIDDRGHPSGYAFRFDFNQGRQFGGDELSFHTFKRALCVRGSGK